MRCSRGARRAVLVFAVLVPAFPLRAQPPPPDPSAGADEPRVEIHGYGNWAAGVANRAQPLIGSPKGEFANVDVALNIAAQPLDALDIHVQPFFRFADGAWDVDVDFAAATWTVSDFVRLHVGKVRQPIGLYAEIFDVGTLRPFYLLPQSIYGPAGIVAEGYFGGGLSGAWYSEGGWGLSYDVYGGQVDVAFDHTPEEAAEAQESATVGAPAAEGAGEEESDTIRGLVGGRLALSTPIAGLRVVASGYTGEHVASEHRQTALGGAVEYLGQDL